MSSSSLIFPRSSPRLFLLSFLSIPFFSSLFFFVFFWQAAEVSRRDIEKAVRERLTVEEQLLTIKFERRTMELEVRALPPQYEHP